MKKEEFIKAYNLTEDQFYGKTKIYGTLDLRGLTNIPEGFNPIVGYDLYLSNLTSIPKGFNPTVGGGLYLSSLTSIPEGFNPTIGGYLDLCSLTSIPEGFNPTVGGYLDLCSLTSIPEGFNPTVGGYLYLSSLTSIPEGFNPTVGGYLYLDNLKSIPEGFNPTVGGHLYLGNGLTANYTKLKDNLLQWNGGKYISVDGIFSEVISKKGNVYKVKKLNSNKEFYIVSDGNGKYSHGNTIKEAKADLIYKLGNIDKSAYADYTTDTVLSFEKAIECYRVITGACSFGTKDFVENNKIEEREYCISEIIELTDGKYGNETFKNYFVK